MAVTGTKLKLRKDCAMQAKVTVEEWVTLFRETGLNEAQMKKWHHLFETRYPEGHQSFLEWLGLSEQNIERIRTESR
jgi:hypothetical protein